MAFTTKTRLTVLILQIILVNNQILTVTSQIFDKQNLLRGTEEERIRELDGITIEEEKNNYERGIEETNAENEEKDETRNRYSNNDEMNIEDNNRTDRDPNITDTDDYFETTTYVYRTTDKELNENERTKFDFANIGSEVEIVDEDVDVKQNTTDGQSAVTDTPAGAVESLTAPEDDQDQAQPQQDAAIADKGSQNEEDRQTEEVKQSDDVRTTTADVTERANTPSVYSSVVRSRDDEKFAASMGHQDTKASRSSPSSSSSAAVTARSSTEASLMSATPARVRSGVEASAQRGFSSEPEQKPPQRQEYKPLPSPTAATKSLTLKSWLEDKWLRPPPGLLVPLRPTALRRALSVWNDLIDEGLKQEEIVLIGYDANGVNWRSHHNLQHNGGSNSGAGHKSVAETLSKLLMKYQSLTASASGESSMKALASSAKMVPYDSALFLITDKGPTDTLKLPLALRALVEKRLKVFTIWTDPSYPSAESARALTPLVNVSQHTEGDVLPYSLRILYRESANMVSEQWDAMGATARQGRVFEDEKTDILMIRRGGGEAISLGVPVEGGVTALRVYIEGLVEHAVLYPPYDGPQIDLYNATSVQLFSPLSRTDGLSPRDVYLVFPGARPNDETFNVLPAHTTATQSPSDSSTVGQWHLSVRCDTCDYRLCLTARSMIHVYADLHDTDLLKIRVEGPVASVRESLLVDEYGNELAKLPFSYEPTGGEGHELLDTPTALSEDMTLPKVKGGKVYVKIVGRDVHGSPFVRLSGPITSEARVTRSASLANSAASNELERVESPRILERQPLRAATAAAQAVSAQGTLMTTVQIGLSTRLYGAPGDTLQLHFEVTNYRDQRANLVFGATDDLGFLRSIQPNSQNIISGQTANVIVSVVIPSSAQLGARDTVTFTVYELSREVVSISAYVYVQNAESGAQNTDIWPPEMTHSFQGSCIGRQGSDCAQHTWSVAVTATDRNSGLLRISSTPPGLVYQGTFVSGTREPVTATYRATCCAPRIVATAVDANGNMNSYVIDVSSYINEAGIAAIVLGVVLLIVLIILLVVLIRWCVRRRQDSRELPYSTASRNLS